MSQSVEAWERQARESDQAWEAWQVWRDLPPGERSHREVATRLGKSRTMVGRWSVRWRWVERVQAFARWDERQFQEERQFARRRVSRSQAKIAGALIARGIERLRTVDVGRLSAKDLALYMKTAMDLERAAWGFDRVEHDVRHAGQIDMTVEHSYSEMSDDALDAEYERLSAEYRAFCDEGARLRVGHGDVALDGDPTDECPPGSGDRPAIGAGRALTQGGGRGA